MTGTFRRFRRGALGVLLFAAVLSPIGSGELGGPAYARPLALAALAVAMVGGGVMRRIARPKAAAGALYVLLTLVMSMPLATVLREQANPFYTPGALLGGMLILLFLHVGAAAMRHLSVVEDATRPNDPAICWPAERLFPGGVERLPPHEIRVVRSSRQVDVAGRVLPREPADSGTALDDLLADAAAWLLFAFWILVALGRRHVASGALLVVGAILLARCFALLPNVLVSRNLGAATERRST